MKKEKKQKCRASIARLSVSEPNRERKLKNKNLEREKARRDFIRQIETKKDAGYRRGCLSLNKGKSPERDLSPGTCLVRMFITDLIKKVFVTSVMNTRYGLGERIRTSGLLNPIQARYQTALHPDIRLSSALSNTVLSRTMCILALEYGYVNPFFRIF